MVVTNPVLVIVVIILIFFNVSFLLKSQGSSSSFSSPAVGVVKNEENVERSLATFESVLQQNRIELLKIEERMRNDESSRNIISFEELLENAIAFSKSQVSIRKMVLAGISKADLFHQLYGSLAAEVFCPNKVRIGTMGDGGKWVCDPWKIPNDCVMFSLGLNNHVTFEQDLQRMIENRCQIFGYDSAEQNSVTKGLYTSIRGKTMKALISNKTVEASSTYSIADLAKMENLKSMEILKIDIEGAEHYALIPFLESYTVCQIFIEVHDGSDKHAKLLRQIGKLGYRLFSYEVNGFSLKACEYSFIHESCVDKYGGKRIANYLDF